MRNVEDIIGDMLAENDLPGGCPQSSPLWAELAEARDLNRYRLRNLTEAVGRYINGDPGSDGDLTASLFDAQRALGILPV